MVLFETKPPQDILVCRSELYYPENCVKFWHNLKDGVLLQIHVLHLPFISIAFYWNNQSLNKSLIMLITIFKGIPFCPSP